MAPSIVIIGAGPGGLMSALELKRLNVGQVRILERSDGLVKTGDAFSILPPALSTIHHYPLMRAEFDENVQYNARQSLWRHTGGTKDDPEEGLIYGPAEAEWNRPGAATYTAQQHGVRAPWLCSRPKFMQMLVNEVHRQGIEIEWGVSIIAYTEDPTAQKAIVKTSDGRDIAADLIIAADGVGTKSHLAVTGKPVPASSSGYAVFRGCIPLEKGLASRFVQESIGWKIGDRSEFRIYIGPDMHMNVILTDDGIIPVLTHKDSGNASEYWHATAKTDEVVKVAQQLSGWDPAILEILKNAPDNSLIDWKLMWRDPQPKWVSDAGRIVQVGDSAHSFLPTSGNGATQAIEDTISLAACLAIAGGADKFPQATRVHNLLRFERTATLQKYGFVTRQGFHHLFDTQGNVDVEKAKNFGVFVSFGKWLWTHSPDDYAIKNYGPALSHIENGTPFHNTNLPPGYTYEPWTISDEMDKEKKGIYSDLKKVGDWSF